MGQIKADWAREVEEGWWKATYIFKLFTRRMVASDILLLVGKYYLILLQFTMHYFSPLRRKT
jgi:hypothetical protein